LPPSSDGPTKKTRSLRVASCKSPGGQPEHKGTPLRQAAQPTEPINHPLPGQCERFHPPLPLNEAQIAELRKVFDVPEMSFAVVEHRTLELARTCDQVHVCTSRST
jgi:transposase